MVGCPRCQAPFVAEEETQTPVVVPQAKPANKPKRAVLVSPPRTRASATFEEIPASEIEVIREPEIPDPEHDPHTRPVAGLPISVLIGLALLPFGIPLMWLLAPMVTGQDAALSLAVPISLAFSASALCLGVVYTIDWKATSRIKGVLMLVSLAYLTGAGLFFLKKDMMDRVQQFFGKSNRWVTVQSPQGKFRAKLPERFTRDQSQPLPNMEVADTFSSTHIVDDDTRYYYRVAASKEKARDFNDEWFKNIATELKKDAADPQLVRETEIAREGMTGRQWEFKLRDRDTVRIVQVLVKKNRYYYLAAEGPNLTPDDEEFSRRFFNSFEAN
jgi:hypothetical protein